jgi:hypothetical protein
MKHSRKQEEPDTKDEVIIYAVMVALIIFMVFVPSQGRTQNPHAELGRQNPDFAADLRGDAAREPAFERDIPVWTPNGLKGWVTPQPDGSAYFLPASPSGDSQIIHSGEGVYYGD